MKHRIRTRYYFDFDSFIKAILLLGFWGLFIWLEWTQQLNLYIHPKFSGIVKLASNLLLPMFLTQIMTIVRPVDGFSIQHKHGNSLMYLPFIFVLALAFGVQTNTLDSNLAAAKGLNTEKTSAAAPYEMTRPLAAKLSQMSFINVTDRDYTEIMNEFEFYSQDYVGKEISMTGFVFRPPAISQHQFSLVRYVIVCCAADALPYCVLCELKAARDYEDGTWLTIRGIIEQATYDNKAVAAVRITSAQKIKEPANPYVYPPSE